jgi:recombination-promoting nuclease RpnB
MELLLKQSRERTFLNWIQEHPALVVRMTDALFDLYGISSIVFILGVESKHSAEEILGALGNVVPHKKETIMTAAQQLELRGIQKGIQEGIQEGIEKGMYTRTLDIAKNMLARLHLNKKTVSKATGLSEEELMKLQEAPN